LKPDSLTHSQEWPRLNRTSCQRDCPEGSYFILIHGLRPVSPLHNSYNTWGHENREALVGVELAKNVSRKQRHFNLSDPIDALALCPISRGKNAVTLDSQTVFDDFFVSRSNVQSVPKANTKIRLNVETGNNRSSQIVLTRWTNSLRPHSHAAPYRFVRR